MRHEKIYLKDYYSFLGEDGRDPYVEYYLPYNMPEMNRENQKRPCMVVCPGGGYWMCSERESEAIALKYLSEGFNVFVINYSVQIHRFPNQLREVAALMELIHKNADEWNCDTEKIAIIGFSAGGHLAAHYSTCYNCDEVREVFPESKRVNASILCYPVISINFDETHQGSFKNLTGSVPETEELKAKFSCESNVTEDTPPAFIWHTAEDDCVPVRNSLVYAEALSKHKIPFELHIYPFGWHGLSTCDAQTINNPPEQVVYDSAWLDSVKKWLKLIFKI